MRQPHALVAAILAVVAAQGAGTPATFSVDGHDMRLRSAVAIASAHPNAGHYSTLAIYFYAFAVAPAQLAAVSSTGRIDVLEARREQQKPGEPDRNHSRAVLNLLLDRNARLTNASLEVPGLTCTIVVDEPSAPDAIQLYENDGHHVRIHARGTKTCDMTNIGGGKHPMSWDVDATVPVFTER